MKNAIILPFLLLAVPFLLSGILLVLLGTTIIFIPIYYCYSDRLK